MAYMKNFKLTLGVLSRMDTIGSVFGSNNTRSYDLLATYF